MLGGQHHVRCAKERVGAGREDADHVRARGLGPDASTLGHDVASTAGINGKIDFRTHATANPVALHVHDRARPVDIFELFDQSLGISRDAQHPLRERHADHGKPAALALAVDDFLIREHGAELGAPVHRHERAVGQPFRIAVGLGVGGARRNRQLSDGPAFSLPAAAPPVGPDEVRVVPGVIDLEEDPLRPLVIAGVGCIDFAFPVVREPQRLDLAAKRIDVRLRGDSRMRVGRDGILLGGQAEGVPAHRVQYVEPPHPLVPAVDIRGGVTLRMAHVQARAAGIRKHVEDKELGPRGVQIDGAEGLVSLPLELPLGFDALRMIRGHRSGSRLLSVTGEVASVRGLLGETKKARRGFGGSPTSHVSAV